MALRRGILQAVAGRPITFDIYAKPDSTTIPDLLRGGYAGGAGRKAWWRHRLSSACHENPSSTIPWKLGFPREIVYLSANVWSNSSAGKGDRLVKEAPVFKEAKESHMALTVLFNSG